MHVFTNVREILIDNLSIRFEIEEIKKQLVNHDKNVEPVFNYLDELIEKHENPKPWKVIGFMAPVEKEDLTCHSIEKKKSTASVSGAIIPRLF